MVVTRTMPMMTAIRVVAMKKAMARPPILPEEEVTVNSGKILGIILYRGKFSTLDFSAMDYTAMAYHPAAQGSSPKHTIYAFIITFQNNFVLYLSCETNKNKQKRPKNTAMAKKSTVIFR